MLAGLSACDGEKDLIIIDGELPIKTSTLYLVGDATPNGWSIDNPTPMTQSESEPLVFSWEGPLNTGEMKLCLATGSWDNPFIRPLNANEPIGKSGISEASFKMYAGNPDDKWKVVDAGIYNLVFDLRNWSMSATFIRDLDKPAVEPIETETLFIVGDATPNGWDIDNPCQLEAKGGYTFVYEGPLNKGEMKACATPGSWDVQFIRPATNGVTIGKEGAQSPDFVYSANPDHKWVVETPGIYRLTFDLEHWTIAAEYLDDYTPVAKLYMIGEATDGGWSWDQATVIEAQPDNNSIFIWEGELGRGSMKASLEKDFGAPFYRPAYDKCEISATGAASPEMVFTASPDDQWMVTLAGKYRLTFNTADMTFSATYLGGDVKQPSLFMIGEATPGGWSWDKAIEIVAAEGQKGLYVWEGDLSAGSLKASDVKDFGAPFYRPPFADCEISRSGAASAQMVLTADPDDKWNVTEAGKYRLTFNTADMTFAAEYLGQAEEKVPDLFIIGEATAGGWSLDNATQFTHVADGEYTWTGHLAKGIFKACTIKDFGAPFYRPPYDKCEISSKGVASPDVVYTTDPDHQWLVTEEGTYKININIKKMTIAVQKQ